MIVESKISISDWKSKEFNLIYKLLKNLIRSKSITKYWNDKEHSTKKSDKAHFFFLLNKYFSMLVVISETQVKKNLQSTNVLRSFHIYMAYILWSAHTGPSKFLLQRKCSNLILQTCYSISFSPKWFIHIGRMLSVLLKFEAIFVM